MLISMAGLPTRRVVAAGAEAALVVEEVEVARQGLLGHLPIDVLALGVSHLLIAARAEDIDVVALSLDDAVDRDRWWNGVVGVLGAHAFGNERRDTFPRGPE